MFAGLFGIASNALVLVSHGEAGPPTAAVVDAGFTTVESHELMPTIRPETFEPLAAPAAG